MRRLRAIASLGSAAALAGATLLTASVPITLAACVKQLAYQDAVPQQTADGAREVWKVRTLAATDTGSGGFAAEVLWVGTDNAQADDDWVEVGVTDGFQGQNIVTFYTAHGLNFGAVYDEARYSGVTPTVGTTTTFTVSKYSALSNAYIAQVSFGTTTTGIWWTGHVPNTVNFSGGLESTCNNSRIDRTYVSNAWYRNRSTQAWVQVNNGSLVDLASEGGIAWCTQPTRFRYYLHSAIDQTLCS